MLIPAAKLSLASGIKTYQIAQKNPGNCSNIAADSEETRSWIIIESQSSSPVYFQYFSLKRLSVVLISIRVYLKFKWLYC